MLNATYAVEAQIEAAHWWFVGRRRLFSAEIRNMGLPRQARIIDIGTGTGANLRMLQSMGYAHVEGVDMSDEAIGYCREKNLGEVRKADVCDLPYESGSTDLILATDIIEHVDDDRKAVEEMQRILAPGGRVVLTVPAFQFLWGVQDEIGQHKRRYTMQRLTEVVTAAGLQPVKRYYFNYLLFLPILAARWLIRMTDAPVENENNLNSKWINSVLTFVFGVDVWTSRYLRPPFGVSALLIAGKPL